MPAAIVETEGKVDGITVMCDGCRAVFDVHRLRETDCHFDDGDYRLVYMRCPRCGRTYPVTLTTAATRSLGREVGNFVRRCEGAIVDFMEAGDERGAERARFELETAKASYGSKIDQDRAAHPGRFYLGRHPEGSICVNNEDDLWYQDPKLGR